MEIQKTQHETAEARQERREKAVLEAIQEHREELMRYLIGHTGNKYDADDIFQQTARQFLTVIKSVPSVTQSDFFQSDQ